MRRDRRLRVGGRRSSWYAAGAAIAGLPSCAHTQVVRIGEACVVDATTLLRSVTVVCDGVQVEHLPISGTLANLLSAAFGAAAAWFGGML